MSLSIGIVSLPNVGKSTLFNALLKHQIADVGEYPFTTVEPNTGVVEVPDKRLDKLADVLKIAKRVPAAVKFYDIAGIVKGAHQGEGLGNQFLSQIRQVDAIVHLLRGFFSERVPHVSGRVDPVHDLTTVNLELTLADFEVVVKALKEKKGREGVLKKVEGVLKQGKPASEVKLTEEEREEVEDLNLLTLKPVLYVLNLDEAAVSQETVSSEMKTKDLPETLIISAKLETEIGQLPEEEQEEYLAELKLSGPTLNRLIKACYRLLQLITFFTVKGGKQAQAWPLKKGSKAIEAAARVHSDFADKFIQAQVIGFDELVKCGSFKRAKEQGKVRLEGKDYVVKDGEVIEFTIGS